MTHPLRIVPVCKQARRQSLWTRLGIFGVAVASAVAATTVHSDGSFQYNGERPFQPVIIHSSDPGSDNPSAVRTTSENKESELPIAVTEPIPESESISEPWPAARLAIVIDDLGYDRRRGLQAIRLPGRLTVAVMPHTPNARFLAEAAHDAGREIILHHPMQGSNYRHNGTELKGTLTLDMGPADIRFALRQALTSVPHCIGINNHTGSTLTQARSHMYWLMQQVASTDLYYLDSRTTTQTVAGEAAQAWGVPFVSRDVFLDHHNDRASIAKQFKYAVKLAKRRGHAVLIAHPRPLSLELLAQQLPLLDSSEVELVHASELIGVRDRLNPATTVAGGY